MNSMLKGELLSAAGNSILPGLAPTVVLVPMLNTGHAADILQLAGMLLGPATDQSAIRNPQSAIRNPRIVVLSVVEVPPEEPLTMGLDMARSYRALLDFLPSEVELGGRKARVDRVVKVARDVAGAIQQAAQEERADTVLLYWKGYAREPKRYLYGRITDAALKNPPCNVILARLEGWSRSRRVFLPVRGGPAAEQALQVGMSLAERLRLPVAVMHNVPTTDDLRPTKDEGGLTTDDGESIRNPQRPEGTRIHNPQSEGPWA
jgi:nucleotide-binding universal stress UspA family protein